MAGGKANGTEYIRNIVVVVPQRALMCEQQIGPCCSAPVLITLERSVSSAG